MPFWCLILQSKFLKSIWNLFCESPRKMEKIFFNLLASINMLNKIASNSFSFYEKFSSHGTEEKLRLLNIQTGKVSWNNNLNAVAIKSAMDMFVSMKHQLEKKCLKFLWGKLLREEITRNIHLHDPLPWNKTGVQVFFQIYCGNIWDPKLNKFVKSNKKQHWGSFVCFVFLATSKNLQGIVRVT